MGPVEVALAAGLIVSLALLALTAARLRSAVRGHRRMLDSLPQAALALFDRELRIRFAAGEALQLIGARPEEIVGAFLLGRIPPPRRAELIEHCRAALGGERRSFEYRSPASGREYWVRVAPVAGAAGEIVGGLALALDISDRSEVEQGLGISAADVDAVAEATRTLARSVEPANARVAVCDGARQVAGAPVAAIFEPARVGSGLVPRAAVGANLTGMEVSLKSGSGAALAFTRAEETFVRAGAEGAGADREFLDRAGAQAVLWHPVVRDRTAIGVLAIGWREPVEDPSLRLSGMIDLLGAEAAVAIGRADLLGRLERAARTDGLTGLPNRRHWEQQLPRELARSWRERRPICVAMLDLDHFKAYNDRRGHQAGDQLLRQAAESWRATLRPYDILARYGGEEFSVILPGCTLAEARTLIERLRAAVPQRESCSAGIAEWDSAELAGSLVGRADAALYRAKRSGRNRTVAASPSP